ncbi:ATP-binding protein [Bradyrhizobium manausense]|uniref:ATP-binding protein n=1 Tax=Bradyrhizobium manausense TaxID=989370 RepID=UPI00201392FC|nr:ATP-binding protein [Bradyrhizobium manausense]
MALLYCRDDPAKKLDEENDSYLSGGLPPSPSTIKKFVGRMRTVDQVFRWLRSADEPRTFLYGKGGSGKTTIAYEVAKTIKLHSSSFHIFGGDALDNIIFVSAKQRSLDVMSLTSSAFVGLDFSNERELYEAILTLGNWSSQSLSDLSLERIKNEMREFLDLTSNFIVVDDVDTLTVNGLEAGFDFLYGLLWRAKRRSKLLYTLRNAPSQSLANAIEVPGLEEGDYEEFVEVCRSQFRVQTPPDRSFVSGRLSIVSERRPLVIESIIALTRTAGSYSRAVELFEEGAGEDVRRYVFQREWNSLSPTNHGRYVLAVLALNAEPLTFSDLVALTRYEESRVRDALADVREMFLIVNEVGKEATYQLGEMTRSFILEQSKRLDQYAAIKERVAKYRSKFFPDNPVLSRLRDSVESLAYRGWKFGDKDALRKALELISSSSLPPKITEDPRFNCLQAFAYASQRPAQLDDARSHFDRAFVMKYEPDIEHLKPWYFAEKESGQGTEQCLKIADFICNGRKYDDDTKLTFLSRKASVLFNRGRENIYFDPSRGISDIESATLLHLSSFEKAYDLGSSRLDKFEEYARNSAYVLFQFLSSNHRFDDLLETILRIVEAAPGKLDPIEDPIARAVESFLHVNGTKPDLHRLVGRLEYLGKRLATPGKWYDRFAYERLQDHVKATAASLSAAIKKTFERKPAER